ncbi:hypothetical protein ACQ4M3_03200 [Leptolyngbya sp. AN03gr2]|uniref:hypothetical protein n=1 Tax=unclassified Leptolyngbya TaxID=2650499 RepID=UPI003D31DBC7
MSQTKNQAVDTTQLYERGRSIFEKVLPELMGIYYNWFILIEPDSGDYFVDMDELNALTKARQKHPQSVFAIFRLNETGNTGRV